MLNQNFPSLVKVLIAPRGIETVQATIPQALANRS